MVKIVGHDPEAVKTITCANCATKLEYTQSEVKEEHGTDYGGGPDGKQFIQCPQCNKEVTIRAW